MVVFRRAFPLSSFWICVYINIEITHISRRWGTPQNFLLAFIDDLWKTQKMRILKKWKKNCWRYHHFTNVYQKPQSYEVQFLRYGVNFFLSFWAIFCPLHLCTTNDDHTIYGSWHIKCDRHNSLSFQAIFFPFTPLTIQKIKILKKWKKAPGDIIILHMSTINQNHMMYDSWDIERDRQNFYHFGPFFALLPLPATPLPTNPLKGTVKW